MKWSTLTTPTSRAIAVWLRGAATILPLLFVLSWDSPSSDEQVTRWKVYRRIPPSTTWLLHKTVIDPSVHLKVPPGGTYCWRVQEVNILGQLGPRSPEVCRSAPPQGGQ